MTSKINIVWDMETGDPDDLFTLMLLCDHPLVNLKAVTITLGTPAQVGLVERVLDWFGLTIPIGAYNLESEKKTVSDWYYQTYGNFPPSTNAVAGYEILAQFCDENTTLLTGAPLKNLKMALQQTNPPKIGRWVAQGGFAGAGVVPEEMQLLQFKGLLTCPTFNFNGDPKAALAALAYEEIGLRRLVSKNVCHRVYYDPQMHQLFADSRNQKLSLKLIWQGMEAYLKAYPEGKKFHDPLAMCCAIDEQIGTWAEVEVFRQHGEWGSRLKAGTNTWIIIDYDHTKFVDCLIHV